MSLIVEIQKKLGCFTLSASFEAKDGVTGLLGASGCGKSMTLKCIAGIERPDSGRIFLDGVTLFDSEKRIDLPPQKRHVGYLFQNDALFPNMTVRENILCGLRHEKSRVARKRVLIEMMDRMGLAELGESRPGRLSGGQQQRVALARILVNKPKLLMLDEPFSALDSHLREKLQIEMKSFLKQYGGPSLLVTHSRDEAYRLSNRIALMDQGRILTLQDTKQLFRDPGSVAAAAMTGCKNISSAERIDEHTLFARDWGIRLTTALPIRENLAAVGIRAHYFNERSEQNRFSVRLGEEIEEPFECIIPFRTEEQPRGTADLWWRMPKEQRPQGEIRALGVAPVNVLPLYRG